MNRLVMLLAVASTAALLGCGGGEVVVEAQLTGQTAGAAAAAPQALSDLSVTLLPYDRDEIFDSLSAAYSEPEPPIPDELLELQQQVAQAQAEWQAAQATWNIARDSLKRVSDEMANLSRASAEYRVLFAEFSDLEQREQASRDLSDAAFERFTGLQAQFAAQAEEVSLQRQQWANEAFRSVDSVIMARLDVLGLEALPDTTNTAGLANFQVPPGQWWVYARFEMPYQELYWNLPIEVERGDSVKIELTRENAQVRAKL